MLLAARVLYIDPGQCRPIASPHLLLLLLLGPCDGRELKGSGGEASGGGVVGEEKQATGLPLIPTLPPVLGPGVQLPPVPGVPGLPPARKTDNKSP